jgi:acyl dehydratase
MSTPTDSQKNFEAIVIGQDMGTFEMTLDEETVKNRMDLVRWQAGGLVEKGFAPPGLTISHHARMKFDALPKMRVSIWAKSEQEFLKPMQVGSKIFIRGEIIDKYTRRGRNYIVTEMETTDESGEVLMRSRETGVYVE